MSKKLSRRQFLTYTFGGTAGFLASGMLFPMVRFAIDPVLKKGAGSEYVETTMTEAEITDSPKAVKFTIHRKDGWYQPPQGEEQTAWVFKQNGKVVALSPVCKHLGCTVNWNSNPQFKDEFFCPCHFGRYYKDGRNVPGTPPAKPLDKYKTKIENGRLLIGPLEKA
ncbi:ubiquinol-cytochrome c reductase iron-sulfur subunit [Lihuaxuella thermophila]|uniref:Menaquinol:cytochrome c reductase iron-sulfur subunit n=1 Tax=Lihuaxuella thermophila TaxID=1173111 RepID=A0A1H8FB26_9BACL|nr:ubiquinol-cytochrome c reductase iron-sulfur subunit [Lihuaxuella thermophila]SEN28427.1 menaquinol-cytochrome c reductase iron-sulfur subunit [Lihuaxuella thermophila]